jgi:hypothetical protein
MLPVAAGLVWLITANLIAMFPSRDHHWTNAYILIALGVPILAWTWWSNGPLLALAFLVGGASVLRWPVYFLVRWCRTVLSR